MQIGSAIAYAAPLPRTPAARSLSSEEATTTRPVEASTDSSAPRDPDEESTRPGAEADARTAREAEVLRQEQREIADLASRDREVRVHEQAHASVGGAYAGAPTYTFKRGPDGKSYAVAGEVGIDTSPVPNDPEATLRKMELVQRAALAPAEPSAQDLRVAAEAAAQATQARAELAQLRREEAMAAAETRGERREERLAEDGDKRTAADEDPGQTKPSFALPPGLDIYQRLAPLQTPSSTVDLMA